MKISVIIPVYNVESVLERCIESLIHQVCSVSYEIILVDDGSTDGSESICDKYITRENIKVIHKKNSGVSDARNVGMSISSGEYFIFVDPDDYVDPDYIEILYQLVLKYNTKIAITGYYVNNVSQEIKHVCGVFSTECILKRIMLQEAIDVSAWAKIFHRSVFENAKFPTDRLYEDMYLVPRLLLYVDNVALNTHPAYHYILREGSISQGDLTISQLDLLKNIENIGEITQGIISDDVIGQRFIKDTLSIIKKMMNGCYSEDFLIDLKKILLNNKYWNKRFTNPYVPLKFKLELILLLINKKIFRIIFDKLN